MQEGKYIHTHTSIAVEDLH